ncbi:saccharopine dehydrogenase C-terminal domain-containing protein [Mongoliitalea daihaiensis]|uniref:saccharopine dehydrogenase C-terminal domain-containing protein n=1 Tax=Mongoliitalea daihaiensis TaxID=2782006 RepID=UPI001F2391FE|nr:saccharopine dehydrogenase C-terminal domain-containing protein [Mongoliitalea daihaiensis]UJP65600.1 saccharopine dehydrogenase NADP-binding domain-containing protein [Mongoliitalea daihaiensis]
MNTILIFGAGKSATYLIDYLLKTAAQKNREIVIADLSQSLAEEKIKGNPCGKAVAIDLKNQEQRRNLIANASIVISMLPAHLHPIIAKDCLALEKHFFTASYESEELNAFRDEIEKKELLFLNECGLDPGIDHMSAMKIIDAAHAKGYTIQSFKSFTGGLMAPGSDNNPWKYKFTWNPRNVVLAGQGTAKYLDHKEYKYIPYHKLFERFEKIDLGDYGIFEGYANRDSLGYREVYKLQKISTLLRGTLRKEGFCNAWNVFIQLGMTDDSYLVDFDTPQGTKRAFLNSFLPFDKYQSIEQKLTNFLPWIDEGIMEKIAYLGLFSNEPLPLKHGSPAAILQAILEPKWQLQDSDKDLIVMQHIFEIKSPRGIQTLKSSLVEEGLNQTYTAMAKTVGLPLAIAADLFLDGKVLSRGLLRPTVQELYEPILHQLEQHGIIFHEDTLD